MPRNLILAYLATAAIHVAYLLYLRLRFARLKRDQE